MPVRGWYRFVPEGLAEKHGDVLHTLGVLGLNLRLGQTGNSLSAGVVFFENESPAVFSCLEEAKTEAVPVLAVWLGAAPLTPAASWRLLHAGAGDVNEWRGGENGPAIAARLARWLAVDDLLAGQAVQGNFAGRSAAWRSLLRQVVDAAHFSSAPCLLLGESGTGKELAARLIHTLDPRPAKREMVVVDCSAIVAELSGSEFFGHERGAYTGAVQARDGAFALANGGTLFLDEAGELPLGLQAQLLRAVQEGVYKRVGGNEWQKTEFRLVCATNRDLAEEVREGRFRRDLYYRIAGCVFRMPPLRERPEDIVPLAERFAAPRELDPSVRAFLISRDYPGNVRDLQQVVLRMARRHAGPGRLTLGDIAPEDRPDSSQAGEWRGSEFQTVIRKAVAHGASLKDIGREAAECAIRSALEECQGSVAKAARRLGVTDRALQMRRAARREEPVRAKAQRA